MHLLSLLKRRRPRPPNARADAESARAHRTRAGRPRPRASRLGADPSRRPLATPAAGRRPGRPPRAAAGAACRPEASSWRRKLSSMLPESGQRRDPKPPASSAGVTPAAAPAAQRVAARLADDRSRTRASRGPVSTESSSARASSRPTRRPRAPATPPSHRSGRAPQRPGHRLRLQPPRDEREDLRRGAVQPLLVIDQAHQRLLLGDLGEQAQHGEADEEAVRRRSGTEAERRAQRIALRHREPLELVEHRRQQLMQPGEGELHLRLDTGGTHQRKPDACSARWSSSAVLPTPGSPRKTSVRLHPREQLR